MVSGPSEKGKRAATRPLVLQQCLPPVEAMIGSMGKRQDGRVDKLPRP